LQSVDRVWECGN